jgi:hypothetical protein
MPLSGQAQLSGTGTGSEHAQMNSQLLKDTAKPLFADHKGLLAMDESNRTCNKRFEKLGIPQTVEARRAYRELIVTTPGLGESIGGAILYDETIRHRMHRDWRFWIGAVFMAAALAVYVLSGDLAWVPNGHRQSAMPANAAN